MSSERTFLDLRLAGDARPDEIDDFVDQWHEAPGGRPLHEHLGMTGEEYSLWLRVPDALAFIVEARRAEIPLTDAVVHECRRLCRRAASVNQPMIARIEGWLKANGVSTSPGQ